MLPWGGAQNIFTQCSRTPLTFFFSLNSQSLKKLRLIFSEEGNDRETCTLHSLNAHYIAQRKGGEERCLWGGSACMWGGGACMGGEEKLR